MNVLLMTESFDMIYQACFDNIFYFMPGAVALPSTFPSSNQSVASGLWPPSSVILNPSIIHNVAMNDDGRRSFFDKEKCSGVPCTPLDDTEAEAEAAASAVAVAAISNDEISACTLGTGSTSDNVTEELNAPGISLLTSWVTMHKHD